MKDIKKTTGNIGMIVHHFCGLVYVVFLTICSIYVLKENLNMGIIYFKLSIAFLIPYLILLFCSPTLIDWSLRY